MSLANPHSADAALFEKVRARFPGTSQRTYLDVASRSLIPQSALAIAADHLAERANGKIDKDRYFALIERVRGQFAQLIGADPGEVALTKNVSEGLNIIASSIDWKAGDEVIVCSDLEHPNNIYCWRNQEREGAVVRDLPAKEGMFPLQAVLDILKKGGRTRVVTVSGTSFKPGFRTDLDTLGRACRAAGVLLVVDGAQSIGITHLNVAETQIDALAVSTQKGLCSLYGMGFLYVRKAFADSLTPRQLARFGVLIEGTHEADYSPGSVKYRPGALRFDLGNYNFIASALVSDAMELILQTGTEKIDRHVTRLTTMLADGLQAHGLPVLRPAGASLANILCIRVDGGGEAANQLQQHLQAQNVQAAVRRKLLRFSMHFYNNEADIEVAIAATRAWAGKQHA
ncbi:MAG: hypothetical protein JWR80_6337 [Bradyrhizobium sp.]|nr:hypothetical protein [Bradyrhizobium sp.]